MEIDSVRYFFINKTKAYFLAKRGDLRWCDFKKKKLWNPFHCKGCFLDFTPRVVVILWTLLLQRGPRILLLGKWITLTEVLFFLIDFYIYFVRCLKLYCAPLSLAIWFRMDYLLVSIVLILSFNFSSLLLVHAVKKIVSRDHFWLFVCFNESWNISPYFIQIFLDTIHFNCLIVRRKIIS